MYVPAYGVYLVTLAVTSSDAFITEKIGISLFVVGIQRKAALQYVEVHVPADAHVTDIETHEPAVKDTCGSVVSLKTPVALLNTTVCATVGDPDEQFPDVS